MRRLLLPFIRGVVSDRCGGIGVRGDEPVHSRIDIYQYENQYTRPRPVLKGGFLSMKLLMLLLRIRFYGTALLLKCERQEQQGGKQMYLNPLNCSL